MKTTNKNLLFGAGIVSLAMTANCGITAAAGFSIREQSTEGQGASFAGVAAGTNGPSAMFWNPATMTQHNEQGYISESNASIIKPTIRARDGAGIAGSPDSGDIGKWAILPASYSVYGLTDDITIGMVTGAPFGLATNAEPWVGSPHGNESSVKAFNVNPNIAYKFNDLLSIAVGVQGEYMNVKLTSDLPNGTEIFRAKADDIAFGFTAGLLFEPNDSTSIGIGFRSSIDHSLNGDGDFASVPILGGAPFHGEVRSKLRTPEMLTFGIRQQMSDDLALMAGVEWANWSRFKELSIIDDASGIELGTTPEKWKDSWFFSLGAEYAVNDQLMVRGGLAYENSGVPDSTRTPRVPDNDRYWLSAGASYKVSDWITANLAYSYVFIEDGPVSLTAPTPLTANFKQHLHILSAGATLDW